MLSQLIRQFIRLTFSPTRLAAVGLLLAQFTQAQGTAFTYQGRLGDNGSAATGNYDFQFSIYDAATNGSLVGGPLTNRPVAVTNGIFTVTLDFGAGVFDGSARWLRLGVRTNGGAAAYTLLNPAQPVTAAPYAVTAGSVVGGATAGQLAGLSNATIAAVAPLLSTNESRDVVLSHTTVTNATTSGGSPLLALQSGNQVPSWIWSVQPLMSNEFSGNFGLNLEGAYFNGVFDNVATLGWNQSGGGQRQNPNGTANWLQWEHHYQPYPNTNSAQDEFHLDFIDLNGNSDRVFFYGMSSTDLSKWYAHYALDWITYFLPSSGYGEGAQWMQQSPTSFQVVNPPSGTGFNFNLSSAGSVFLNPNSSPTNQALFLGNGTGNDAWAAVTISTKTYGQLSMYGDGLIYTAGSSGAGITSADGGFSATGAASTAQPGLAVKDTSGNANSRDWLIYQSGASTAQGLDSHYGALDIRRTSEPGGDFRPDLGGVLYSRWDTNAVNWTFVNRFCGGIWLPNTNLTNAATSFVVATNKQVFAVTIAAANQYAYVTNAAFTSNTYLQATLNTDDATAGSVAAIPAAGYCTLKLNAAPTGDVRVSLQWQNP